MHIFTIHFAAGEIIKPVIKDDEETEKFLCFFKLLEAENKKT